MATVKASAPEIPNPVGARELSGYMGKSYTGGWKKDCIYALQTKLSGYALHGFYVGMPESAIEAQATKMGYGNVNGSGDDYRTYNLAGKKIGDVNYSMMVFARNGSVYAVRLYALKDGFWAP